MKKSMVVLALVLVTGFTSIFAAPKDGINVNVTSSFQRDFNNAKEVKWENGKAFIKATFRLNDQITFAYYSTSGDLLAVSRNILSSQLPINQLVSLNKNYSGYWITDLFEMNAESLTSYYVTVENADVKVVLKSTANGWEIYNKQAKQ